MTIRESIELEERKHLSPFAAHSADTRGRLRPVESHAVRTDYMRDRDRILHSKAFRRLKEKTQVFLLPRGDHYRTRMMHTLEVSQIARTVAKALRLNEDLVEAIALGHDLGHTPFGHAGERALNKLSPGGFQHNRQSLRVVDCLENDGQGMNLTWETRNGILNHQMSTSPATLEGKVVRLCDKIAYIHHDTDDAQRAGILTEDDIPITLRTTLGYTSKERLNTLVLDLIHNSMDQDDIRMSDRVFQAMMTFRQLMYADVYTNPVAKSEEVKVERIISALYGYLADHPEALSEEYRVMLQKGEPHERVVCDYISGMTDQFCIRKFEEIFVPRSWDVF